MTLYFYLRKLGFVHHISKNTDERVLVFNVLMDEYAELYIKGKEMLEKGVARIKDGEANKKFSVFFIAAAFN